MTCREVEKYLQAYVDGEFSDQEETEIEQHFKFCPVCQKNVAFQTWFKQGLKQSLPGYKAPVRLKAELTHLIRREQRNQTPLYVKLSPAIAVVLILLGVLFFPRIDVSSPIVEASVEKHMRDLPFDVQSDDYKKVSSFFQEKAKLAIRIPRFRRSTVRLIGGRASQVQNRPVAYLSFGDNGRKYTLVAAPVNGTESTPLPKGVLTRVNNRELIVTHRNGFSIVVWKANRMMYSLVSDDDDKELVNLAANADYDL